MKEAIIATVSTVIGAIVGWILGKINIGKIHVTLSDYREEYLYTDSFTKMPRKKDNELYSVKISFKISLFNSFSINKAIRNCTLEFFNGSHKLLLERSVKDADSRVQHPYGATYESVEVINISAYESKDIKGIVWLGDIELLRQVKKIRFRFEDERFHKHYLKYKVIDFQKVPQFKTEDNNGG